MSEQPGGPFEIGLVMAGAVSGGAYTAGVLDFLVEAIDAWYEAKSRDTAGNQVPNHKILLKAVSGASAGSMSAAILATALGYRFLPKSLRGGAQPAADNPFYDSWVKSVGIADLLDTSDLESRIPGEPPHRLISLLNSRKIDQTVRTVLSFTGTGAPFAREWVVSNLPVLLAVGNLRGVPYGLPLRGAGSAAHPMVRHGDHMSFAVEGAGTGRATVVGRDFVTLTRPNTPQSWAGLGDAAMASGAFPFALRPRLPHLIETINGLREGGVGFRSLQEQIDTTSADGRFYFHMLASLAEFERELISERTRAGMASARRRGKHIGRPRKLTPQRRAKTSRMSIFPFTRPTAV